MTTISLKGRTLFITGASRGIGKAIALRAARDGANVVVAAKTVEPHPALPGTIHTVVPEIEAAGGKAFADFMIAPQTQDGIKSFGVEKFGQSLFVPVAGKKEEELGA